MDEYTCPKCGAILNDQKGFDPEYGAWRCLRCGQMIMDEDTYNGDLYEGVAWYCDECGALLNKQDGFSDIYYSWNCTECGHENFINEDEIDDGDENQQDSDNGQRDHDSFVRRSFRSPYIPLEMCIMQIAQAESLADTVNFVRIHIIAKKRY